MLVRSLSYLKSVLNKVIRGGLEVQLNTAPSLGTDVHLDKLHSRLMLAYSLPLTYSQFSVVFCVI